MKTVRPHIEEDEAQVVALWNEIFGYQQARNAPAEVIGEYHRNGSQGFLVACDGERVLGTIMAGYDGHRGWLYRLAVTSSSRRNGIATSLFAAARAYLIKLGYKKLNIQLHTDNIEAHAFWRSLGLSNEARICMGMNLTVPCPTLSDSGC